VRHKRTVEKSVDILQENENLDVQMFVVSVDYHSTYSPLTTSALSKI